VHEHVTGALNIYATIRNAFDDAITIAQGFAEFAAIGLANAYLYDTHTTPAGHLRKATENRAVIEQAKGIIMGEPRCTADEAFVVSCGPPERRRSSSPNCRRTPTANRATSLQPWSRTHTATADS
jgi:hypothetical protein